MRASAELSTIGELRIGTSPRLVMATRLIVPEELLRAAGWNGELTVGQPDRARARKGIP